MNIPFSPMDVIDNTHGNKALSGRVRILGWHHPKPTAHKDNDIGSEYGVWVIDLPRNSKRKETQRKGYYDGPYREPLSKLTQIAYFGECDRSFRRIVTGGQSDVLSAVSVT